MIMGEAAIRVEGLGKRYRIPQAQERHNTLRDTIAASTRNAWRTLGRLGRQGTDEGKGEETFWALQDVSFELQQGEVLGVIGANGAGKSTLLKLLSRITEPTAGRAEIRGRVGSLLEVGTGFHSELTGRENIYLNGAILGMNRREINRKFDEMVAFAEVEKFIDTPIKHYSTGMYLRLAFAVAAHLEPEILIVDEVLAVGDASFQKKCLGKMGDVSREGRTVLFVSHNMDAIQRLCSRCVLLEGGKVAADGVTTAVVPQYLARHLGSNAPETWIDLTTAPRAGTGEVRFAAARYAGDWGVTRHLATNGMLEVHCLVDSDSERQLSSLAVTIYTRSGTKLVNADTLMLGEVTSLNEGRNCIGIRIERVHLNPGTYVVGLWAGIGESALDHIEEAFEIEVIDGGFGSVLASHGVVPCSFRVQHANRMSLDDSAVALS